LRISIGLRLFASVLLAILAVAATGIGFMRQNVMQSFSEYAANIELDRLDELSHALVRRYEAGRRWDFLPDDDHARRGWIARELERLQQVRNAPAAPPAPAALPAPPAAPASRVVAPAAAAAPALQRLGATTGAQAVLPPLPPLPPPAIPPVPPAPPAPPAAPALAAPPVPPAPPIEADVDQLGLHERVTLLDAEGRYLAGRMSHSEATAQRPIEAGGQTIGYLAVARVLRPSDALAAAFLGELKSSLWAIVAASVALSALAAVLLAAHFRRPIQKLAAGARDLAEGRFDTRLAAGRSDELGALAHSFNQLAERLGAMEESRRQWVADTSHELRTPLAVLRAQLEAIEDGVRPADPAALAGMLRQVLALNKLIDQLYALARADVGALDCQRVPLDLWALARDAADSFADRLQGAALALDIGPAPPSAQVLADPDRLRQVFANLFENALRYTAAGGRVAMHARVQDGQIAIDVEDSAPGVPDQALDHLAERFYRVDASRSRAQGGAGLGLALCQRILAAHGARIDFGHSPLGGLRATVVFPLERI
jgi:two-component system sensor histidine kinase BaeS